MDGEEQRTELFSKNKKFNDDKDSVIHKERRDRWAPSLEALYKDQQFNCHHLIVEASCVAYYMFNIIAKEEEKLQQQLG